MESLLWGLSLPPWPLCSCPHPVRPRVTNHEDWLMSSGQVILSSFWFRISSVMCAFWQTLTSDKYLHCLPTSLSFCILSSTVCYFRFTQDNCFLQVSKIHPSSKFVPLPGVLARVLNPMSRESTPKSIKFCLDSLTSGTLDQPIQIPTQACSPGSCHYMLTNSGHSFAVLFISSLIRPTTFLMWVC